MQKDELLALAVQKAEEHGLDHELVLAMVEVESNFNPLAVRHEPKWSYPYLYAGFAIRLAITADTELVMQSCSWGLMQVMGSVMREQGMIDNLLRVVADPSIGLDHGCIHLRRLFDKHPLESLDFIISAYNAGTPEKLSTGKFVNQTYVDKVKRALEGKVWQK